MDDAALVARARTDDQQAFAALVQRHQATVYRVCYRVLGNREDAEDAAQEAFLRAYRKLDTFRGESAFGTWLLRLAVNVALNEHQRRRGLLRWGRPSPAARASGPARSWDPSRTCCAPRRPRSSTRRCSRCGPTTGRR